MSLFSLFLSPSARRRAERRARRHAFREAENAVEDVRACQKELEKESSKQWAAAREALKSGEKAAANRALTGYRASQVLAMKLEQKRWVFEQYLTRMQVAQSDTQFAEALAGVNKIMRIDPERVADVFDAAQETLGEQVDADRFWDKLYNKEMEGVSGALEDHVPSLDEMSAQLETEVAAEVGGAAAPAAAGAALDARIAAGQERVRKILEGK